MAQKVPFSYLNHTRVSTQLGMKSLCFTSKPLEQKPGMHSTGSLLPRPRTCEPIPTKAFHHNVCWYRSHACLGKLSSLIQARNAARRFA